MIYLLAFVAFEAAWFVPFLMVFRATRLSSAYAYISLVPIIGPLVCAWVLALRPWPLKGKLVRVPLKY
ncbi:hypothetical protein AWV80_22585 [Cupriavidus sp. UYMU48A]|nr:hypothetical protein AWV80_22585 [Cupriavidus sp. UYMU48A]